MLQFAAANRRHPDLNVLDVSNSTTAAFVIRGGNGSRRAEGQQSTPMNRPFEGVRQRAVFVVEMGIGLKGSLWSRCCGDQPLRATGHYHAGGSKMEFSSIRVLKHEPRD